jgi:hypothetical protein
MLLLANSRRVLNKQAKSKLYKLIKTTKKVNMSFQRSTPLNRVKTPREFPVPDEQRKKKPKRTVHPKEIYERLKIAPDLAKVSENLDKVQKTLTEIDKGYQKMNPSKL